MASIIKDLGNEIGYIYKTLPNGTTIMANWKNDPTGARNARRSALVDAPFGGETLAYSILSLSGAAGTITNLTVNGVAIFDTATAISGASLALIAVDAQNKINAYISSPNYTAFAVGTSVYIYAVAGSGSTPNGFAIATATTGGLVASGTDMAGGSDASGLFDAARGHRYYLDATSGAIEGDNTSAVEITAYILNRGLNSPMYGESATIASNALVLQRNSAITILTVDTEGGAGTDNLDTIATTYFQDGDILIIRGAAAARIVTVRDNSVGSGNIYTSNATSFDTDDNTYVIELQLKNTGSGPLWYELSRSPSSVLSIAQWRDAGINFMDPGGNVTALGTSGTYNFDPDTDVQHQMFTGSPVLIGNITVAGTGTPQEGDNFEFLWRATPNTTTGTYSVNFFGTVLTDDQATGGNVDVIATYLNAAWNVTVIQQANARDFVDATQLATKEASLGNPAVNGYILSSTTAGARSWIPNAISDDAIAEKTWNTSFTLTGNTDKNFIHVKPSSSTHTTTANRVITLATVVGANNTFTLFFEYCKVGTGFTTTIVYGATTLYTMREGTIGSFKVTCIYNSATDSYFVREEPIDFTQTVGGNQFPARVYQQNTIVASYAFSTLGGSVSTIDLATVIPAGTILFLDQAYVTTSEAFTSGGAATIAWGISGIAVNTIDAATAYTDAKYAALNAVGGSSTTGPLKITTAANITFTIAGAAVTAGAVVLRIPCHQEAVY
jgi:hypothetical protein